jgi:acyl carrier protein
MELMEITTKILSLITAKFIGTETDLREYLEADDLDMVEIKMTLEEIFQIEISDVEFETVKTVGDLIEIVNSLLSK